MRNLKKKKQQQKTYEQNTRVIGDTMKRPNVQIMGIRRTLGQWHRKYFQ